MSPSVLAVLVLMTSSNFCRGLNRKVGRLRAFENAVGILRRAPDQVVNIVSVGDQASAGSETWRVRTDCTNSRPPRSV